MLRAARLSPSQDNSYLNLILTDTTYIYGITWMTSESKDLGKKCLHFNYKVNLFLEKVYLRSQLALHSEQPRTLCMTQHERGSEDFRAGMIRPEHSTRVHIRYLPQVPPSRPGLTIQHQDTVILKVVFLKGRKRTVENLFKLCTQPGEVKSHLM